MLGSLVASRMAAPSSGSKADHEPFLRQAIELSRRAALDFGTGGAFGALIVKEGQVIATGMNRVVASHDPTWHGEMEAIRLACITLQSFKLPGCVLYTSAEPCPMCLAACYWAGIEAVVYAASVEDALTYGGFDDRPIYEQLALPKDERSIRLTQLLREEALEVWKAYQARPDRVRY
ncbi:MAG: dCMP deaminase [Cyanobium sp. CACIAM 14]|nr:MAG: dCMP deaminase [Cyanobium sp. CACIAM 14]